MINKVVYSHWSKPMGDKFVGFNSEKMFVASAYLSVILNLKYFNEVELVTDQRGKELFIDKWKIPFTNVVVCLDKLNHIDQTHWAIGKLEACAMQTKPFMHQDLDVFWFKRPPQFLYEAQACFQNLENDTNIHSFYLPMMKHADDYFENKRPFVDYETISAVNCGIMAFNDLSVIPDWYEYAMEYVAFFDKHADKIDKPQHNLTSLIFEQLHLYYFLKNSNIEISYLGGRPEDGNAFLSNQKANELGYTHMISSSKRNKATEDLLMQGLSKVDLPFYKKVFLSS